jgi:DNA-binding response OmpR family regulator
MGSKVLIVEDDVYLVKAYEAKLATSGFDVKIVTDGSQALDALESFKPDVIVLDLVMPRLDGFAFLQRIKEHPQFKSIPIIVASNLGQKSDIDKVKDMGVVAYIVKSDMSLDDLVAKISATLKQ